MNLWQKGFGARPNRHGHKARGALRLAAQVTKRKQKHPSLAIIAQSRAKIVTTLAALREAGHKVVLVPGTKLFAAGDVPSSPMVDDTFAPTLMASANSALAQIRSRRGLLRSEVETYSFLNRATTRTRVAWNEGIHVGGDMGRWRASDYLAAASMPAIQCGFRRFLREVEDRCAGKPFAEPFGVPLSWYRYRETAYHEATLADLIQHDFWMVPLAWQALYNANGFRLYKVAFLGLWKKVGSGPRNPVTYELHRTTSSTTRGNYTPGVAIGFVAIPTTSGSRVRAFGFEPSKAMTLVKSRYLKAAERVWSATG